jgi:ABC-type nitrate/sulfonate/bicarbonate transport system permease component
LSKRDLHPGRFRRKVLLYSPALVFLVLFLGAWQWLAGLFQIPAWLLPTPVKVWGALWHTKSLLWQHARLTVLETTAGFILATLLGIAVSSLMTIFPYLKRTFYPFLIFSQTVPLIAVAPLLLLWLGYGLLPKIIIVILVCFFPVAINLLEGLELSDRDLLNLLRSMGASNRQIFIRIRWPQAMPSFFAGLKIAATYSVMAAVIGEWLGASQGLGVYLTRSSNSFLTDRVFAAIIAITILSFLYYALIIFLAKLFIPWYSSAKDPFD